MSKNKRERNNLIIHWQENKYEQKMNDGLSKISDYSEQLKWLNEFELKYKNEVQSIPYLAEASAIVTAGNPHKAGFDAMIQNKRDFIKQQIELTKPIRKKQEKEIKSLRYQYPEILESLYEKLLGKYIHSDTSLEQFKAAFTEKPKESTKPIQWIRETNLLAYFLDKEFSKQKYQSIVESCQIFISKNGRPITASSISTALYQITANPKGSEKLDKILASIKK